jgi:hypothetical protein
MLLAKKNFIAANAVQIEIHDELCDRQWDRAMTTALSFGQRTKQVRANPRGLRRRRRNRYTYGLSEGTFCQ